MKKVLTIVGTRPEVIKMAPIIKLLGGDRAFDSRVCATGQHRQMLDQFLSFFEIRPDFDLNIMSEGQSLTDITSRAMLGLAGVFSQYRPDYVLIQGDTTTAMASAVAAFYQRVKIGHVEAGLRTRDLYSPWPEEANRRVVGMLTHFHFAPTKAAQDALLSEGVPSSRVFLTGNTIVDALHSAVKRIGDSAALQARCRSALPAGLDLDRRLVVVTGHRRENFGPGLERVLRAIAELAGRGDVQILYPVHLNPNVQSSVRHILTGVRNVFLTAPLDYVTFVYSMMRAHFIITDSGGIQEEAPILGKPVLVTRENTERPEAVFAGTGMLVGTDDRKLLREATRLLEDPQTHAAMSRKHNALGDGHAAERIVRVLKDG